MASPGSLQNLNPIVLPDAVGLLPLATGWKVLLVIVAIVLLRLSWRRWLNWRADFYRRQALAELSRLDDPQQIPGLLKRTALSAFDRNEIAGLNGQAWHQFLDRTAQLERFHGACGDTLDLLAYGGTAPEPQAIEELIAATRDWIRLHGKAS